MSIGSSKKEYVEILSNLMERLRETMLENLPRNSVEPNEDYYSDSDSSSSSSGSSSSSSSSSSSKLVYSSIRQEEYLDQAARVFTSKHLLEACLRIIHVSDKKMLKARKKILRLFFQEVAYDIERTSAGKFFLDESEEMYDTGTEVAEAIVEEYLSDAWIQKFLDYYFNSLQSLIKESDIDNDVPELISASDEE